MLVADSEADRARFDEEMAEVGDHAEQELGDVAGAVQCASERYMTWDFSESVSDLAACAADRTTESAALEAHFGVFRGLK